MTLVSRTRPPGGEGKKKKMKWKESPVDTFNGQSTRGHLG